MVAIMYHGYKYKSALKNNPNGNHQMEPLDINIIFLKG